MTVAEAPAAAWTKHTGVRNFFLRMGAHVLAQVLRKVVKLFARVYKCGLALQTEDFCKCIISKDLCPVTSTRCNLLTASVCSTMPQIKFTTNNCVYTVDYPESLHGQDHRIWLLSVAKDLPRDSVTSAMADTFGLTEDRVANIRSALHLTAGKIHQTLPPSQRCHVTHQRHFDDTTDSECTDVAADEAQRRARRRSKAAVKRFAQTQELALASAAPMLRGASHTDNGYRRLVDVIRATRKSGPYGVSTSILPSVEKMNEMFDLIYTGALDPDFVTNCPSSSISKPHGYTLKVGEKRFMPEQLVTVTGVWQENEGDDMKENIEKWVKHTFGNSLACVGIVIRAYEIQVVSKHSESAERV